MPTDEQRAVARKWLATCLGATPHPTRADVWHLPGTVPTDEVVALIAERESAARAGAVADAVNLCRRMVAGVWETPHEEWIDDLTPEQNHAMRAAIDGVTIDTCQALEEMLLNISATPPDRVVVARETIEAARDVLARCRTWFAWQFDPAGRAPAPKEYGANLVAGLDAALARLGESSDG